ncbi:transcription factor HES-5-like [Notolabrus celidotus]|uniref:transcription factor HES-5-like n=1 Tax=Notolabrus celidotus TaxID=1203425 RepID=UPI00149018DD|nr:transcription factor HES-5-like [Notolabrus celidotus]
MAPCSSTDSQLSLRSTKDRHKMRKPLVEKMRRDRINTCIEQLKVLLEKEFTKQDPNAKLEKADVLEMTVVFLKQQLQPQSPQSHGYSRCWKETLHFLSSDSLKEVTLPHLHLLSRRGQDPNHVPSSSSSSSFVHGHIQAVEKQLCGPHRAVWRPW